VITALFAVLLGYFFFRQEQERRMQA
jgi:hypothetical protein